jgi:hypothetical protein
VIALLRQVAQIVLHHLQDIDDITDDMVDATMIHLHALDLVLAALVQGLVLPQVEEEDADIHLHLVVTLLLAPQVLLVLAAVTQAALIFM